MSFDLIIPPGFSAGGPADARATGLAAAGPAYLDAGLADEIAATGRPLRTIIRLDQDATAVGERDEPVALLGEIGSKIAGAVGQAIAQGSRPILAGGTCVALPGMLGGLQRAYGPASRIGLVWFDAHGDFNTPKTTLSGMLGGMPVAVSAGLCHAGWRVEAGQDMPIPTDRIIMVDVRNLDPAERELVEATDVTVVPVPVDGQGTGSALAEAVADLAGRVDHIYLHVDADVLDARFQPNHPTMEPDGPDVVAVSGAIDLVTATGKVRAFGLVSVDPTGPDGAISLSSGLSLLRHGAGAWANEA